jgi:hypothetical protein
VPGLLRSHPQKVRQGTKSARLWGSGALCFRRAISRLCWSRDLCEMRVRLLGPIQFGASVLELMSMLASGVYPILQAPDSTESSARSDYEWTKYMV